jgi:hypothetical protein
MTYDTSDIFADFSQSVDMFKEAVREYETKAGVWSEMVHTFCEDGIDDVELFLSTQPEWHSLEEYA